MGLFAVSIRSKTTHKMDFRQLPISRMVFLICMPVCRRLLTIPLYRLVIFHLGYRGRQWGNVCATQYIFKPKYWLKLIMLLSTLIIHMNYLQRRKWNRRSSSSIRSDGYRTQARVVLESNQELYQGEFILIIYYHGNNHLLIKQ